MSSTYRLCIFCAALLISNVAQAGSTFTFLFKPTPASTPAGSIVSVDLVLRETFDGTGSELFDSTNGPGLFSFSVAVEASTSTSGTPAVFNSVSLNPAFSPVVSSVTPIGPPGAFPAVELNGAINPISTDPLTNGPATGAAGTLDIPIATMNIRASSIVGDTTTFASSAHPMAGIFPTLDGTGAVVPITYGETGQVTSIVPEPAGLALAWAGAFILVCVRRRHQ